MMYLVLSSLILFHFKLCLNENSVMIASEFSLQLKICLGTKLTLASLFSLHMTPFLNVPTIFFQTRSMSIDQWFLYLIPCHIELQLLNLLYFHCWYHCSHFLMNRLLCHHYKCIILILPIIIISQWLTNGMTTYPLGKLPISPACSSQSFSPISHFGSFKSRATFKSA